MDKSAKRSQEDVDPEMLANLELLMNLDMVSAVENDDDWGLLANLETEEDDDD